MGDTAGSKRCRDEPADSPETKRFKEADLILEILDGEDAGVDPTVDHGLDDFIRSLEEEFTATGPPQPQVELGYLLEASDDELGLPPPLPAVGSSPASSSAATDGGVVNAEVADEGSRFGHVLWGFEEETLGPYEGLDFGILENGRGIFESEDYLCGDGGLLLFDCSDLVSGPSDYSALTWQSESLPSI